MTEEQTRLVLALLGEPKPKTRGPKCSRLDCGFFGGGFILHFDAPVLVCDECLVEYHQTEQFARCDRSVTFAWADHLAAAAAAHCGDSADACRDTAIAHHDAKRKAAAAFRAWLAATPRSAAEG